MRWWLLFALNWVIGLIVLVAALPSAIVRLRFSGKLYQWQRSATAADRQSWYLHYLLTNGSHAKEIRLFDLGAYFKNWFVDVRRTLRRERLAITTRRSLADLASAAIATLAVFGTFAYVAKKTIQGTMKVGSLVGYYMLFQTSLSALQQVLTGLAALYEDNLFLTYFHEFLALEHTIEEPAHPRPVPRPITDGVVFDDVSFQYPQTERTAIDGRLPARQAGRGGGARGHQRLGQDHAGQAPLPPLQPTGRQDHARRHRPARVLDDGAAS